MYEVVTFTANLIDVDVPLRVGSDLNGSDGRETERNIASRRWMKGDPIQHANIGCAT